MKLRANLRIWVPLALILLLASALRLRNLDGPALWWDEGNNAYFALQSPTGVLEVSRATHDADPPAHRLALGLWLRLVGPSAFNLRLFSVVLGVATVWLLLHWGAWLAGPRVGLLAAGLLALAPMAVYYSREAKSYPFVTFLALLALSLWTRYLHDAPRPRPLLILAYGLAQALALGAHYYAVFFIAAQGIWLVSSTLTRREKRALRQRRLLTWLAGLAITAVLMLPWVLLTYRTALTGAQNVSSDRGALGLAAYLRMVGFELAAGPKASPGAAGVALFTLGLAALAAFVPRQAEAESLPSPHWRGLLATLVLLPVAGSFVAQWRIAFFSPRFLLYTTPALYLLAALGLERLFRQRTLLPVLLLLPLLGTWASLWPTLSQPFGVPEEDLRPLVEELRQKARPDDQIVVSYIWQEGMLRMYAPDLLGEYHLGWFEHETIDQELRALFARRPHLWLLTYQAPFQHPSNASGWWLEQHAARAWMSEHGHSRVALYLPPCREAFTAGEHATFEQGIHLAYPRLAERVAAGQPFAVSLFWTATAPLAERYAVFVHMIDASGKVWAQSDGEPLNGLQPFTNFMPGEPVSDCRALLPPAELPAGRYQVVAGLYRPGDGVRLQRVGTVGTLSEASDQCLIGEIEALPGRLDAAHTDAGRVRP